MNRLLEVRFVGASVMRGNARAVFDEPERVTLRGSVAEITLADNPNPGQLSRRCSNESLIMESFKQCTPQTNHCRTFFDGDFEIAAHAHREFVQRAMHGRLVTQLVPKFA